MNLRLHLLVWTVAAGLGAASALSIRPLVGLGAVAVAGLMLVRPERMPPIILATAMFVPFGIQASRYSAVPASLILALLGALVWGLALLMRTQRLPDWRGNWLVLGFGVVCLISWLAGRALLPMPLFERPGFERVQAAQLVVLIVSPLILLLVTSVTRTIEQVKLMVGIFVVGAIAAQPFWLQQAGGEPPVNTNGMFSLWAGVLCWTLLLSEARQRVWLRLGWLALFLLLVYRFFFLGITWFSGWAPLAVAVVAVSFLRSRFLVAPVALLTTGLIVAKWGAITTKYVAFNSNRPMIWGQHFEIALLSPILGLGPAGYAVFLGRPLGYASHNNYLDILSQTGSLGLVLFLGLFGTLFVSFLRGLQRSEDPFIRAYLRACLGALAGLGLAMMQGDWVVPFAYNQTITGFNYTVYSWLMLGAGLALCLNVIPREKAACSALSD